MHQDSYKSVEARHKAEEQTKFSSYQALSGDVYCKSLYLHLPVAQQNHGSIYGTVTPR
jgi:hypothetical protein